MSVIALLTSFLSDTDNDQRPWELLSWWIRHPMLQQTVCADAVSKRQPSTIARLRRAKDQQRERELGEDVGGGYDM